VTLIAFSPYRTSKHTGTCSWSFRFDLKRNSAAPAPREEWRVGGLIVPRLGGKSEPLLGFSGATVGRAIREGRAADAGR